MTDIKELKNTDGLVDINDISVDKDLPKSERIKEYIRQIKNPYRLTAITLLSRLTIYIYEFNFRFLRCIGNVQQDRNCNVGTRTRHVFMVRFTVSFWRRKHIAR